MPRWHAIDRRGAAIDLKGPKAYGLAVGRVLVQLAGHPGSGKSTLARQLVDAAGGAVLDLDSVKTALLDAGAGWAEAASWSYSVFYAVVEDLLGAGTGLVVVDTPSYWPEIHQQLTAAAERHHARYVFLECVADPDVRMARLAGRTARRSQVRDGRRLPVDAPADMQPPHLRAIERPRGRACIEVDSDGPVDIDALLARLALPAG